jgi:hypothetical protein
MDRSWEARKYLKYLPSKFETIGLGGRGWIGGAELYAALYYLNQDGDILDRNGRIEHETFAWIARGEL